MVSKHLAIALIGTALVSWPALAQTQPAQTPATTPSTTAPAAPAGQASSMGSGSFMTQMQANQWEASDIEGLNVYNNNNEKIGDISELIIDQSGKIQAVVIGVGGFLGLGERDVAVPFEQIQFVNEPRATAAAPTTTTAPAGAPAGTAGTAPATTGSTTTGTTTTTTTTTTGTDARRSGPDHAMLNMTKDQLKAAPEFKKTDR